MQIYAKMIDQAIKQKLVEIEPEIGMEVLNSKNDRVAILMVIPDDHNQYVLYRWNDFNYSTYLREGIKQYLYSVANNYLIPLPSTDYWLKRIAEMDELCAFVVCYFFGDFCKTVSFVNNNTPNEKNINKLDSNSLALWYYLSIKHERDNKFVNWNFTKKEWVIK